MGRKCTVRNVRNYISFLTGVTQFDPIKENQSKKFNVYVRVPYV